MNHVRYYRTNKFTIHNSQFTLNLHLSFVRIWELVIGKLLKTVNWKMIITSIGGTV